MDDRGLLVIDAAAHEEPFRPTFGRRIRREQQSRKRSASWTESVDIEATAFKDGIVIAQVNEIVDKVPRVDIPGDRVQFVIKTDKPFVVEPLFTRDPAAITEMQILTAMLAIKGVYAPYSLIAHGYSTEFGARPNVKQLLAAGADDYDGGGAAAPPRCSMNFP
jgi:hypothetical protein